MPNLGNDASNVQAQKAKRSLSPKRSSRHMTVKLSKLKESSGLTRGKKYLFTGEPRRATGRRAFHAVVAQQREST